jgi:hypothetical protein
MANKQTLRSRSTDKKQADKAAVNHAVASPEIDGLQAENLLLEQALDTPAQAQPQAVMTLQQRYGNSQVQRVFNPQAGQEPAANRRGELSRYVTDEIRRARSGGTPMPAEMSSQYGRQFGSELGHVRLHTDQTADRLAAQLQANAFTLGKDIFFRKGAYAPNTSRGRFTLTHELTHVMQQAGSSPASGPLKLGPVNDSYEQAANRTASDLGAGLSSAQAVQGAVIQRDGGGNTAPALSTPPRRPLPPLPPRRSQPQTSQQQGNPPTGSNPQTGNPPTTQPQPQQQTQPQQQPQTPTVPSTQQQTQPPQTTSQQPSPLPTAVTTPPVHPLPPEIRKLGMVQSVWDSLTDTKRDIIKRIETGRKDYAQQLIYLAMAGKWPLDGSGAELNDVTVIQHIPAKLGITLSSWNGVTEPRRQALLDLQDKLYAPVLAIMARRSAWPKGSNGDDILDAPGLERIVNLFNINFERWNGLTTTIRGLLESIPDSDKEMAAQLGRAARTGTWPQDGGAAEVTYAQWKAIKEADPGMTPAEWNALEATTRAAVLAEPDKNKKKNKLGQSSYAQDSKDSLAEKGHKLLVNNDVMNPIWDTVSGLGGVSGNIAQLTEGDNKVVSSSIGVASSGVDTFVQGMNLMGSIARLARGNRMARRRNASRAAKTMGAKERREGIWGTASATLGLGNSMSSMVGNSSKLHNQEADEQSGLSARADYASGSFATASGLLGMTKSAIGLGQGVARNRSANKFVVKNPVQGSDEATLSDIASFTAKNQNRMGRSFDLVKNLLGTGGGLSGIIGGAVGGIGGTISSAVFGGLGVLTGIGGAIAGAVNKPKDSDISAKVDSLVALIRKPYDKAQQFAKEVLKLPADLIPWLDEDEEAAKDLIKSKLSKY